MDLREMYDLVGREILSDTDFNAENLASSLAIFEDQSLSQRRPLPKKLDVIALVSGLEFDESTIHRLTYMQDQIASELGEAAVYFVEPPNLAVEYFVFKWPSDPLTGDLLDRAVNICKGLDGPQFDLVLDGIQIHRDGCLIARGYDSGGALRSLRNELRSADSSLPHKQSNWAHIPLGRILEPIGADKFFALKTKLAHLNALPPMTQKILTAKLVFERRWYMTEYEVLYELQFRERSFE